MHTIGKLAGRLDAGLSRRWGEHEEFVTALFVEIDPEVGRLSMFNCGHPPPILISADGVTVLEVPARAPPLGLLTLGDSSGAARTLAFKPNDQLLLYTNGVTEARDRRRSFYPLDERLHVLQAKAKDNGTGLDLLEAVSDDLLRHSGAPLEDDAALLLRPRPCARWPDPDCRTPVGTERGRTAVAAYVSRRQCVDHRNVTGRKRVPGISAGSVTRPSAGELFARNV